MEDGYEFFAKRQLVTLFSAPNYCGEFDNAGAMMSVDDTLMCSFQVGIPLVFLNLPPHGKTSWIHISAFIKLYTHSVDFKANREEKAECKPTRYTPSKYGDEAAQEVGQGIWWWRILGIWWRSILGVWWREIAQELGVGGVAFVLCCSFICLFYSSVITCFLCPFLLARTQKPLLKNKWYCFVFSISKCCCTMHSGILYGQKYWNISPTVQEHL